MQMQGNISQSKYVEITSGVGGASAATEKELILRMVTANAKVAADTVLEFEGLDAVGAYFGTSGEEYAAASKYFGFVSKAVRSPQKISFYRSTLSALAPFVRGTVKAAALGDFKDISDGSFSLSMGGLTYEITGLDFSTAPDYATVASAIETKIRANADGGELWASATVAYDPAENVFVLTGGTAGDAIIVAPSAAASGTDITGMLGWSAGSQPIVSQGTDAQSVSELLAKTLNLSNNFGSLSFLPELTAEQITEAAQYTHAQNMQYQFLVRVEPENYAQVQMAVSGYSGVCLVYDAYADNSLPHILPAAVAASADYNAVNGAPGYDYQKDDTIAPSVTDDATYDKLVPLKVNFIGRTQQAGLGISFYQPGFMQGAVEDQGVYMNEVWLKDKFITAVLNTQLGLNKWPAGEDGLTIFDTISQPVREAAKNNGTVSVGKTLTDTQKVYITQLTGDADAWQQVQTQGDYMVRKIVQKSISGTMQYVLQYTYIYSKGDQIRKVEGSHILI